MSPFAFRLRPQGPRGGRRSGPDPARAVLHRQVAGAARRLGAERGHGYLGLSRVFGLVKNPGAALLSTSWKALGEREQHSDIHCVTRWTKLEMPWRGVPMATVLDLVEPTEGARFVIAHAEQGFTANLPIEALRDPDVMLRIRGPG